MSVQHIVKVMTPDGKNKRLRPAGIITCKDHKQAEKLADMISQFGSESENVFETQFHCRAFVRARIGKVLVDFENMFEVDDALLDLQSIKI